MIFLDTIVDPLCEVGLCSHCDSASVVDMFPSLCFKCTCDVSYTHMFVDIPPCPGFDPEAHVD